MSSIVETPVSGGGRTPTRLPGTDSQERPWRTRHIRLRRCSIEKDVSAEAEAPSASARLQAAHEDGIGTASAQGPALQGT